MNTASQQATGHGAMIGATHSKSSRRKPFYCTWVFIGALLAVLVVLSWNCGATQIHQSVIAGSWYPADPVELKQALQSYLARAPKPSPHGRLVSLIVPHAGYRYSGQVAAYAYRQLQGKNYDTVVVIAPSHFASFPGVSVYDRGGYQTPLGIVPLDTKLVDQLKKQDDQIRFVAQAHRREHAVEIQLPFLQTVLPRFKLVPLVMGEQSWTTCKRLAAALSRIVQGKSVLIVASSDLSHYHPVEEAKRMDGVLLDRVAHLDPKGLYEALANGRCEACGGGPIVTALLAGKDLGVTQARILHYGHSGEVTGDDSAVVGYLAAALWASRPTSKRLSPENPRTDPPLHLSAQEKTFLLGLARKSITAHCLGQPLPAIDADSVPPTLREPCGAFVTLHKDHQLRGCIGNIIGRYPLVETVSKMAVAAAFQDPRFPPVQKEEIPRLKIEISVLTPLEEIEDVREIQVGRHGIFIRKGFSSGILLPQVATQYHWDRMTFLQQTCRKAGLPKDAWKDPRTRIYIFEAEVFSENQQEP